MRNRNRTSINTLTSFLQRNIALLMHKLLRHLLTQINRQETLRQFHSMELRSQRLQNLFPISVAGQAAARRTSDAMLAVQLDIERVESVAAGRQGDADGVVVRGFAAGGVDFVLGFVEFEADLREVVEFGNRVSGDLGRDAAFEDAVEERVDVGLFGEVDERLGVIGSLDCWQKMLVGMFFVS